MTDVLDCSSCKNLLVLRLSWREYGFTPQGIWITNILDSLGSRILEHVRLEFSPWRDSDWLHNTLDCQGWERALSHERQPFLRSVNLLFQKPFDLEPESAGRWPTGVPRLFPDLNARGLLR